MCCMISVGSRIEHGVSGTALRASEPQTRSGPPLASPPPKPAYSLPETRSTSSARPGTAWVCLSPLATSVTTAMVPAARARANGRSGFVGRVPATPRETRICEDVLPTASAEAFEDGLEDGLEVGWRWKVIKGSGRGDGSSLGDKCA